MRFLSLIPRRFYYTTFANGVSQLPLGMEMLGMSGRRLFFI